MIDHSSLSVGVPKYRRGEVWKFLVQQHSIRAPSKDDDPKLSMKYEEILEQPTSHQHAILIDIGKTSYDLFCVKTFYASRRSSGLRIGQRICLPLFCLHYSLLTFSIGINFNFPVFSSSILLAP